MVQKTVTNKFLGSGVVGEFYSTDMQRTTGQILNSASDALNVVGSVLTKVTGSDNQSGVAASSVFSGILSNPKGLVRSTLDAQSTVPNGSQVELIQQGFVFVSLPATAAIGDYVYYSDTTGALSTAAPDAAAPAGTSRVPGGTVQVNNVTTAGIAVIYLDSAGDLTKPSA